METTNTINPTVLSTSPSSGYWDHLWTEALPATLIYSLAGILLAIFAFRLLDWLTPGDLNKKIFEEGNVAAAILGAALVLGICAIIVASIAG